VKNICAWCKTELEDLAVDDNSSNYQITHGICQSCREYFFSNQTHTLDEFLNELDAPVLMVNDDGDVLLANKQALHMLNKDMAVVKDYKIGNVMECARAKLPEGCGHTVHCVACTLRSNINITFKTGKSLERVPAVLNRSNGNIHHTEFLISTEKVDDVVLLRIDDFINP
jgi:hypothetical protein